MTGAEARDRPGWRREQQLRKTLKKRPDLLASASLSDEDRQLLEAMRRAEG